MSSISLINVPVRSWFSKRDETNDEKQQRKILKREYSEKLGILANSDKSRLDSIIKQAHENEIKPTFEYVQTTFNFYTVKPSRRSSRINKK